MTPPQPHEASHSPQPDAAPQPAAAPRQPGPQPAIPFPAGGEGLGEALLAPYAALVVTASNRASAGVYPDTGGPLLAEGLTAIGFAVDGPLVVPDGEPVEQALRAGTAAGYDVIVTTGGTGLSPTDRTPEVTRAVIAYDVPGIPEAIRAEGLAKVPTAALSRGLAGVAGGRTLIINLPGSAGGVRDGIAVLERILRHAVDQIRGGDHPRPAGSPS
ncbi:MogA/MoaB family molybdenum cofactor biosynthesis protein [Streptomyces sp. NPDC006632]|uniref:MogA/MoaB family molybdenum cofactor biosynthesis protein n=1 Tax=unclassified Streptomyces TaxID=2593676 RepID=UPI002E201740